MNINFNFGEHFHYGDSSFWIDLFIAIFGGLIGFGTALFFYYRQNKRDKEKDIADSDKELKDVLRYFQLLITGTIKTIELQNVKSLEFSSEINKTPTEIQYFTVVASKDTDRLHVIDSLRIFLAFRHIFSGEPNWLKDFRNLYNHLDFVDGHLKETVKLFENYRESIYRSLMAFKKAVDGLPDIMSDMSLTIEKEGGDFKTDPRHGFLLESIRRYRTLADSHAQIADFNSKFLEPVLTETVARYQHEFFGPLIMDTCKKARVLLNDIVIDALDTAGSFKKSPEMLEDSKKFLQAVADQISEKLADK
jgi:hypothetical protein